MTDIAIRVENLSKQYPFDRLTATPATRVLSQWSPATSTRGGTRGGRAGCIGGPQARYKTIRESLAEVVHAPFRRAANLLRGEAYGAGCPAHPD